MQMDNILRKRLNKVYRDKVSIKEIVKTTIKGREVSTLEDYYLNCRCNIKDLYGNELYAALSIKYENTLIFETRNCSKINQMKHTDRKFRVEYGGVLYNIYYVDHLNGSKHEALIKCIKAN